MGISCIQNEMLVVKKAIRNIETNNKNISQNLLYLNSDITAERFYKRAETMQKYMKERGINYADSVVLDG